ncbi:glutamate 5-kinase [Catalinimonas alkaloidigena]|uniref:Glutamate 5-kinase n=1 Tax=Catalinimonas alkaloidigena TaxID=1075417 RepID=A0A1G9A7P1_9BACT|nr:glutamate 5-kinase [Catalinimonas alkaloidigena]SDK23308.1 glutamate 5-kinase [Catalinimonas alkaloidigena]
MKPIIVLKLGSSTLTAGTNRISRGKLEDVARQIVALRDDYHLVIVSSGAIATARQFINIAGWENEVASKQAMSAIGQPKLMQMYSEVFGDFDIRIAQCLMTYRDFENEESKQNTVNTIHQLIAHGYVPIINENDTVAVEELIVGDNDKLSALVASLIQADKLVLASDIDGLYDKNPHLYDDAQHIARVSNFEEVLPFIEEKKHGLGTGGMTSKLAAARICKAHHIEVIIVNGGRTNFLVDCLQDAIPATRFVST